MPLDLEAEVKRWGAAGPGEPRALAARSVGMGEAEAPPQPVELSEVPSGG